MSQFISVFDMLKIGVGPSSSHTLGPWRAAQAFIKKLKINNLFPEVDGLTIDLYGSLSLTGKGHATDIAILLGLSGEDPETIDVREIETIIRDIEVFERIQLDGFLEVPFFAKNLVFNREFLSYNPNGMTFCAYSDGNEILKETYFSIGGGFIVQEEDSLTEEIEISKQNFPYPVNKAIQLEEYCEKFGLSISDIVYQNELVLNTPETIDRELRRIWETMLECMYIGCHTAGKLPVVS
jgi:L-serine dehydratase